MRNAFVIFIIIVVVDVVAVAVVVVVVVVVTIITGVYPSSVYYMVLYPTSYSYHFISSPLH